MNSRLYNRPQTEQADQTEQAEFEEAIKLIVVIVEKIPSLSLSDLSRIMCGVAPLTKNNLPLYYWAFKQLLPLLVNKISEQEKKKTVKVMEEITFILHTYSYVSKAHEKCKASLISSIPYIPLLNSLDVNTFTALIYSYAVEELIKEYLVKNFFEKIASDLNNREQISDLLISVINVFFSTEPHSKQKEDIFINLSFKLSFDDLWEIYSKLSEDRFSRIFPLLCISTKMDPYAPDVNHFENPYKKLIDIAKSFALYEDKQIEYFNALNEKIIFPENIALDTFLELIRKLQGKKYLTPLTITIATKFYILDHH